MILYIQFVIENDCKKLYFGLNKCENSFMSEKC